MNENRIPPHPIPQRTVIYIQYTQNNQTSMYVVQPIWVGMWLINKRYK